MLKSKEGHVTQIGHLAKKKRQSGQELKSSFSGQMGGCVCSWGFALPETQDDSGDEVKDNTLSLPPAPGQSQSEDRHARFLILLFGTLQAQPASGKASRVPSSSHTGYIVRLYCQGLAQTNRYNNHCQVRSQSITKRWCVWLQCAQTVTTLG